MNLVVVATGLGPAACAPSLVTAEQAAAACHLETATAARRL